LVAEAQQVTQRQIQIKHHLVLTQYLQQLLQLAVVAVELLLMMQLKLEQMVVLAEVALVVLE
jgi:hypothetical protein